MTSSTGKIYGKIMRDSADLHLQRHVSNPIGPSTVPDFCSSGSILHRDEWRTQFYHRVSLSTTLGLFVVSQAFAVRSEHSPSLWMVCPSLEALSKKQLQKSVVSASPLNSALPCKPPARHSKTLPRNVCSSRIKRLQSQQFSPSCVEALPQNLDQGLYTSEIQMGVSINGGSLIAGWFTSWKIPIKNDLKWMIWIDLEVPPFVFKPPSNYM